MTYKPREVSRLEKLSTKLTDWVGTPMSILVHTILFISIFSLGLFGVSFESILLILTTAVSLEAIYLAIFIQMTVNRNTQSLEDVEKDIDEIQEDVEDIQEDVVELGDDVEEISKDVDEIEVDVDKIHDHVQELSDDDDEPILTQEAVAISNKALENIEKQLQLVMRELEDLKTRKSD